MLNAPRIFSFVKITYNSVRQVLALPRTLATSKGMRMMPKLVMMIMMIVIRMMVDNWVKNIENMVNH